MIQVVGTRPEGEKVLVHNSITFSGGERHVVFEEDYNEYSSLLVVAQIRSSDDIMDLALIKEYLDRNYDVKISLMMPYIPYARQDRACTRGDSFSLKAFVGILNSLKFDSVIVVDPHSDVAPALIDNVEVISQLDIVNKAVPLINFLRTQILISPDAGSNKKMQKYAEYYCRDFVRADKIRDVTDGSIKGTTVYHDDFDGADVTIVDDICDRGGTFMALAKSLKEKGAGKVTLFVTHAILPDGSEKLFENGIDRVITFNSFTVSESDNFIVYPMKF